MPTTSEAIPEDTNPEALVNELTARGYEVRGLMFEEDGTWHFTVASTGFFLFDNGSPILEW